MTARKPASEHRRAGRPSKRTPEIERIIIDAITVGTPIKFACQFAGISTDSFYDWEHRFPDFAEQVSRARGGGVTRLLGYIVDAAAKDWRAAEAVLKLMHPADFAKVLVDQHTTLEGGEPAEQEAETIDNILKLRRAKAPKEPPAASSA